MKNQRSIQKFALTLGLMFVMCFVATSGTAQVSCPYTIKNNLYCDIEVNVTVKTWPGCTPCITLMNVNLVPGQTHVIKCSDFTINGCSNPSCDIEVTLVFAGGSPYGGTPASISNPNVGLPGLPTGCDNGGSGQISLSGSKCDINP